nr:hypothetical protein [Endozoicomonas acroporae]
MKTQIYIGIEIGYIAKDKGQSWIREIKDITAMI